MTIASDEELYEALEFMYDWTLLPNISAANAAEIKYLNYQLIDLGVTDAEGVFKNTVLGKRAQVYTQDYLI